MDTIVTLGRPSVVPSVVAAGVGTTSLLYILYKRWINDIRVPESFPEAYDLREVLKIIKKIKLLSDLGDRLGVGQRILLMRRLYTHFFDDGEPTPEDPAILVTYTIFDGVPVKLYRPRSDDGGPLPGMVYYHGGGCCMGSADDMDGVTRRFAKTVNMVVASVNYRLAPEHVFPVPLDDCVTATKHFMKNAADFGVDANRVVIAGDSSGGYLTAAVSLRLRDENWSPMPKLQVLLYPALQAVDLRTASYEDNSNDPYLDRRLMTTFWLCYAFADVSRFDLAAFEQNKHTSIAAKAHFAKYLVRPQPPSESNGVKSPSPEDAMTNGHGVVDEGATLWESIEKTFSDPYFAPLLAPDMTSLPPAYVLSCQQDILRDDALMYIQRLRGAGVKVTHAHYDCLHALFDMLHLKIAGDALDVVCDYVRDNL